MEKWFSILPMNPDPHLNKFLAIGTVDSDPRVKYVPRTQSYLVEFVLNSQIEDPLLVDGELLAVSYTVVARREKLALYLKDVLQPGLRLFIEGTLVPRPAAPPAKDHRNQPGFHVDLKEVELIDTPDKPEYPQNIKRLDR
ncbi:MAG: hypothetical protein R3208_03765 [Ketobacteraceae bacterium]|nr:hypothetical protein [Ketobacteraceae bacterium]